MITIQPQYLPLTKLLDCRLFTIPEYQRAYSWTSEQREDLFSDIKKTFEKGADQGHFMAAIVALRRKKQTLGTDEFDVMEVVDGQQRLTTLIILLNAVQIALADGKVKSESKLLAELSELLVKVEGDELLLLQTNHDSSQYFANYLRKKVAPPSETAKSLADRELLTAIEECTEFVESWTDAGRTLPSLISLLKNRLFFLLHEIDDEKMVYTVFEVLNSRGLAVSSIDRLKSILMGAAFELKDVNRENIIKELHTTWRDIYSLIGLRQNMSTETLRFAATLKAAEMPHRSRSEECSVDDLRDLALSARGIHEVASWLLQVAKACDAVTANPRINAVTRMRQARLLAAAIHLRTDFTSAERTKLLTRWEKVTFRIYGMLQYDARTGVKDYVRLAWQVINQKLKFGEIDSALEQIGKEYPIAEAVNELRNNNCYEGWEQELRYVMYRYEEYFAKVKKMNFKNEQWEKIWLVSASDSIEHILPQSVASLKYRHRLGNLLVLPPKLNSKLQDDDPDEKADSYQKTGLLIAGAVADEIDENGWKLKSIEQRENEILEWMAVEWKD